MALFSCANSVWHRIGITLVAVSTPFLLTACGGGGSGSAQAQDAASSNNAATRSLMAPASPSTLVWQEPVSREDGSSLSPSEIAEYHVYYKLSYENQFHVISVQGSSTTQLSLSSFAPGIYDFEVSAVDQQGLESSPSQAVRVTVI